MKRLVSEIELFIIVILVIVVIFLLVVKGPSIFNINSGPTRVDIIGEIKSMEVTSDKTGHILVEGEQQEHTEYDKASITINERTKIIDKSSNKKITIKDIKKGDTVEVEFTGPVRESYPIQADAFWVKVVH